MNEAVLSNNVTRIKNEISQAGVIVTYDADGYLKDIYYPVSDTVGEYTLTPPSLIRGNYSIHPPGQVFYGIQHMHQLKFTTTDVIGTGWFTYYYNSVGQEDHKLVYGDCATKLSYDNCKLGTTVVAKNLSNNKTASYKKYDAGGLPEAVLDIWGDGIKQLTNGGILDNVNQKKMKLHIKDYTRICNSVYELFNEIKSCFA